ncbi:MAG: long-chain fatty acid--CoA ligase [Acidobacteriota bacterium]|nr:long-chain fatty acid--CoA ligase [Blastocatellia bacterium]MDW8239251.1 long-chain fatty acid--CoA ligase [Acidobacteriota bacterium]
MRGLMMDFPLTLKHILAHNEQLYGKKEIVSRTSNGIHRYTYADFQRRVRKLANVLQQLGVRRGDRVATFAWNHYQHLELYFAIPCIGAVLHTVNLRLFSEQLVYIFNHAEDRFVFVDPSLLTLLEPIAERLKTVEQYIVLGDGAIPPTSLAPTLSYEALMADASDQFEFPDLDERDALGLCYTSGTTGHPKGVLYSHRAIFLHSMASAMSGGLGLSEQDVLMPVVPMFHANAWGQPFTATFCGCTLVFPGPFLQPRDLAQLMQDEKVTCAAGVPTLWIGLYQVLKNEPFDLRHLKRIVVGGSAVPRSLIEDFEKEFGISVLHAWGMTETSPYGTGAHLKSYMENWPEEERYRLRAKQGTPAPCVEVRLVDEQGRILPWDGQSVGELQVRGPWVASAYYNNPEASAESWTPDGWFRTGDVATIDEEGFMQITDRTKDLIKSGGEWISSVELENALMAHPKVLEASVIAVAHEKWAERPLAVVVPMAEHKDTITKEELIEFLRPRVARWWLPDDVVFVEQIPKTSVGKFDKKLLRQQFADYKLP